MHAEDVHWPVVSAAVARANSGCKRDGAADQEHDERKQDTEKRRADRPQLGGMFEQASEPVPAVAAAQHIPPSPGQPGEPGHRGRETDCDGMPSHHVADIT